MKIRLNAALCAALVLVFAQGSFAADEKKPAAEKPKAENAKQVFTRGKEAGPDFVVQGEYEGTIGKAAKLGAQVIAHGNGVFTAQFYEGGLPGAGWNGKTKIELKGKTADGKTTLSSKAFNGTIADGTFKGTAENGAAFELKKVKRKSPTLGEKPPTGAIVLFDGTNTDAWAKGSLDGKLLAVEARTKQTFKDFTLHIEFRTPFMPEHHGQGRGNSGVYILDQYECQVLDSFGLTGEDNECGGIYQIAKPAVNMCFPPLSWQTYDIDCTAARFNNEGKKVSDAVVTIRHNGVAIHEKLKLPHPTPTGGRNDEKPGALFLQDHGGNDPVRYRNIWIVEKK